MRVMVTIWHQLAQMGILPIVVPREGLEPSRFAPLDFESSASTNSATPAE